MNLRISKVKCVSCNKVEGASFGFFESELSAVSPPHDWVVVVDSPDSTAEGVRLFLFCSWHCAEKALKKKGGT